MGESTGPRNSYGVKDASDCWRTVAGVRWGQWVSFPSPARIVAYRGAGLRVRRFGEELHIHPDDRARATELDHAHNNFEDADAR